MKWFKENKMIVNADKFQVLLIDKRKQDHTNEVALIKEQSIKAVPSVELLGIEIDDKLSFNLRITKICNSATNQLNAMTRLRNFMTFNVEEALINSYFMSNFNCCPLIQMFSSTKSLKRIGNLQKRALRFLLADYESTYEQLLKKAGRSSMSINRLGTLRVEIYNNLNELNPSFYEKYFYGKRNRQAYQRTIQAKFELPFI